MRCVMGMYSLPVPGRPSGLDVNTNGVLDLAGSDRINETATWYEFGDPGLPSRSLGEGWWQCRASILYAGANSAVPTTNSIQKTRLTGFSAISNLTSEIVAVDLFGNSTTSRTYVDRAAKTVAQSITYPDSTNAATQTTINGQLTATVSKTGVHTRYTYDALGRQIAALQGDGPRLVGSYTHYNALGQVDWTMDTASNTTTYTYDTLGRCIAVTDALSNTTYTAYDAEDRVLATWGATYPVAYDYDDYGRMIAMYTLRDSSVVISNYSSFINHISSFDRTRWLYEEATGLLTNKLYADGHGPSYAYTPDGKLASRTWARGAVTQYGYNLLGQLTGINYSDSTPAVTFAFDRLGRQTAITDGSGMRTFAYNDALQLAAETNTQGVLQYAFDNLGRQAGFTAGPDYTVKYSYDPLGRFSAISHTNNQQQITNNYSYSYFPGSDLVQGYTADAGFSLMRAYEPNRNLITSITNGFGGVSLHRFDYVNDQIGRRTQRADVDISSVISNLFAYNVRSELEDAVMGTNNYSYRYDPIGNRRVATNNAEALSYAANSLNQYSQITNNQQPITPSYDLDGNMTGYKDWTFVWDAENRLILASNATMVVSNSYDYMSRRISKTVIDSSLIIHTSSFLYNGWAMFEEVSSSSTNHYVYGLDLSGSAQGAGTIGGILAGSFNGATVFYCYDANGNVTDLANTNGIFAAKYQYDPYGNLIAKSGDLADLNPFRFSTKYFDAVTSLYYYGHRYYMPLTGRWASPDPLGSLPHYGEPSRRGRPFHVMSNKVPIWKGRAYAFCDNHGPSVVDPNGLMIFPWPGDPGGDWNYPGPSPNPPPMPPAGPCGPCAAGDKTGKRQVAGPNPNGGPNGCSVPPWLWFLLPSGDPDNPSGSCSFLNACNGHDLCYQQCNNTSASDKTYKQKCDHDLFSNLVAACNACHPSQSGSAWMECLDLAATYLSFVDLFGGGAFKEDQGNSCEQCSCCGK